ncbi:MAG: NAD(P)-dependent dehydrogenase, short-chain alcohol dehydrogenase family [Frankiales bacterium]|nr:NAD(P)-dependent dehydrogenase, short-chain alcohol dehydrogenase family [Frankiales bacterium]
MTGGASGIGRAIAEVFLEEGARVVISDVNESLLASTVAELAEKGEIRGVAGDVRSMSDASSMVDATVDAYGALDILVCNAGITSVMPIEQLGEEEWDKVMGTNVKGMFTLVKHAVPQMRKQGRGNIVTLGSEMGVVAVPESPAYNASKGAVMMFTKSIALDLIRYNIRVNALCPGITATPLLQAEVDNSIDPAKTAAEQATWAPILRTADPREIAMGALFLASDESSFAVGSNLILDGGFTAQ